MIILIDADIFVYRLGFACEKDPWPICRYTLDRAIDNICLKLTEHDVTIDKRRFYLTASGRGNFRFSLFEDYKANRKNTPKPAHYAAIREFLTAKYAAKMIDGMEADDALSIMQRRIRNKYNKDNSVIVSLDKDLDMVPGFHYNFVKDNLYYTSKEDGFKWFCKQILMGDTADNIPGLKGIGPKKADKILGDEIDPCNLINIVYTTYKEHYEDLTEDEVKGIMERNARLLWMLEEPGKMFNLGEYDVL